MAGLRRGRSITLEFPTKANWLKWKLCDFRPQPVWFSRIGSGQQSLSFHLSRISFKEGGDWFRSSGGYSRSGGVASEAWGAASVYETGPPAHIFSPLCRSIIAVEAT